MPVEQGPSPLAPVKAGPLDQCVQTFNAASFWAPPWVI
jgi:hypothetical protein